jgi:hypothetical protein
MMSNLRRYLGASALAAVIAVGITMAPVPAQANDFDVCSSIESAIAAIENSRLPGRVKDRLIEELVGLAQSYGCEGY